MMSKSTKSDLHAIDSNLLIGFPEMEMQAVEVARLSGIPYAEIKVHHFPDGESKLTLPAEALKRISHVVIYQSLDHPNEKLVELLLAAQGCRDLGVKKLTLIAPYLSYMRQDIAFNPGEVVSQKVIGKLLASYFDHVISVDSHLHRIQELSQAVPAKYVKNLTATEPMADFIQQRFEKPFLLGPDEESLQWVKRIATQIKTDYAVATKTRFGDRQVQIKLPDDNFSNRDVILLDDVASSGRTLIETAIKLKPQHAKSVSVLVTHALFMGNSVQELRDTGVANIWSCNSINHPSNSVSLGTLLAEELKQSLLA